MPSQMVLPKICGYYLSASIITLGTYTSLGENSCNPWRRNGSKGPILDVYDDDDDNFKSMVCFKLNVLKDKIR